MLQSSLKKTAAEIKEEKAVRGAADDVLRGTSGRDRHNLCYATCLTIRQPGTDSPLTGYVRITANYDRPGDGGLLYSIINLL